MRCTLALSLLLTLTLSAAPAAAQTAGPAAWTAYLGTDYRVVPNITYLTASNWDAKLDVYVPRNVPAPHPTVLYIHGGGWTGGTKEGSVLNIAPYLELGFAVVNVEYRLAKVALAPAAVEDCRCALRWVIRNAKEYGFDVTRLITTGHSAGGHLALTTGMLPVAAGLDRQCPGTEELKVAAIVNWFGITDVIDLLDGANMKPYAVAWLSSLVAREEIARRVSPLTYIQRDMPPVITIHGDADPTVPYAHAVRLHDALKQASVAGELVTIPGGRHGGFSRVETVRAYDAIRAFLARHGIQRRASTSSE